MSIPKHEITLRERKSFHMMERHPRYDVMLNGEKVDELYYNMKGYRGGLPTIGGASLDIGERGISTWRTEVRAMNREARECIDAGINNHRKAFKAYPTRSSNYVALLTMHADDSLEMLFVSRKAWVQAEKIFGKGQPVGVGFFREHDILRAEKPAVILMNHEHWFLRDLPDLDYEVADYQTAEALTRYVDEVFPTANPATKLVVTRRIVDDVDPEPVFVDDLSLRMAKAWHGDDLKLFDIKQAEPAPITDPAARAKIRADFTWFDLSAGEDPDEQVREMSAAVARLTSSAENLDDEAISENSVELMRQFIETDGDDDTPSMGM